MQHRQWIGALAVALAAAACSQGNVFSLDEGTCFDDVAAFGDGEAAEVEDVPVVACSEPHDNEVYATFDLEGEEFPGDAAVTDAADTGCLERFEDYVDRDYQTSRYVFSHLVPSERTWDVAGDREVVCFLYDMELEPLEGSAEGSGV